MIEMAARFPDDLGAQGMWHLQPDVAKPRARSVGDLTQITFVRGVSDPLSEPTGTWAGRLRAN